MLMDLENYDETTKIACCEEQEGSTKEILGQNVLSVDIAENHGYEMIQILEEGKTVREMEAPKTNGATKLLAQHHHNFIHVHLVSITGATSWNSKQSNTSYPIVNPETQSFFGYPQSYRLSKIATNTSSDSKIYVFSISSGFYPLVQLYKAQRTQKSQKM